MTNFLQSGNFQYRSVFQGLRSIWQTEGIRGMSLLWKQQCLFPSLSLLFLLHSLSSSSFTLCFSMQVYTVVFQQL